MLKWIRTKRLSTKKFLSRLELGSRYPLLSTPGHFEDGPYDGPTSGDEKSSMYTVDIWAISGRSVLVNISLGRLLSRTWGGWRGSALVGMGPQCCIRVQNDLNGSGVVC